MKKDDIFSTNNILDSNDFVLPIYLKHLKGAMVWSGLKDKNKKVVLENLELLEKESQLHLEVFLKIKIYCEKNLCFKKKII